jgi:hypothetical protein
VLEGGRSRIRPCLLTASLSPWGRLRAEQANSDVDCVAKAWMRRMSCSPLAETETSLGTLRGRDPRPVKVGHQPEASLALPYDRESGKESCEA